MVYRALVHSFQVLSQLTSLVLKKQDNWVSFNPDWDGSSTFFLPRTLPKFSPIKLGPVAPVADFIKSIASGWNVNRKTANGNTLGDKTSAPPYMIESSNIYFQVTESSNVDFRMIDFSNVDFRFTVLFLVFNLFTAFLGLWKRVLQIYRPLQWRVFPTLLGNWKVNTPFSQAPTIQYPLVFVANILAILKGTKFGHRKSFSSSSGTNFGRHKIT